jgi:hypothetical protein
MAPADVATAKAKAPKAINLIISFLYCRLETAITFGMTTI